MSNNGVSILEDVVATFVAVFVIIFMITSLVYLAGWWIVDVRLPFVALLKVDTCAAAFMSLICLIDRSIFGN